MIFGTKGYGGKKVRESVSIVTNDPEQPRLEVVLTGQVETFAQITPDRVYFAGPAGKPLSVEIEIVPRKDLPFTITRISARKGSFIEYEQTEGCADGKNRCVIRVENTRTEKGRYSDALTVHTDSKIKPSFPIYISGTIQ